MTLRDHARSRSFAIGTLIVAAGLTLSSGCADELNQPRVVLYPSTIDEPSDARVERYGTALDCEQRLTVAMATVNVGGLALVGDLEPRMEQLPEALTLLADDLELSVVAMQELYEAEHRAALRDELEGQGWTLVVDERADRTGLALAIRQLELVGGPVSIALPVENWRFGYERGLLCQQIRQESASWFVCSSHYASMHSNSARRTREEQFTLTAESMDRLGDVVLLADLNVSRGFIPRGRWIPRWEYRDAEQLVRFLERSQPRSLVTGTTFGKSVNPRGTNSTSMGERALLGRELDAGVTFGEVEVQTGSVHPLLSRDGEFVTDHNLLRVETSVCQPPVTQEVESVPVSPPEGDAATSTRIADNGP